jgi:hypothetical protein
MASRDSPWAFHKVYPSFDVQDIPGYPNHFPTEWRENCPKFNGDPTLAVTHAVNYMKYASSLNVLHEDVLMKIFVSSLETSQRNLLAHSCDPKVSNLLQSLLRNFSGIAGQPLRICKMFSMSLKTLYREGFPVDDETINEEWKVEDEDSHAEDLNKTFDEDEVIVSSLPLDEDIQASMSCDPFKDLTLFHNCGSEEVLEEPLDMTDPFEKRKTKHSALRIKPRVMKRRWKSMPMKRKKNLDEAQHVEASLSLLPPDEVEVVQSCSPPVQEVEEATSLSDEEFEDPVEAAPTSALPAHEDKEMVIFSHVDGLMKEPLDMVDEHIDTFIQTGRRRWDFGHLIFYRDPIYDIEGSPQEKGFELSSSKDYFSCMYDSYVWQT